MSSKDPGALVYFTGEDLKDGQMVQFFKRFLHKEIQKRVKLAKNDVADNQAYNFCHEVRGIAIVISNGVFTPDAGYRLEERSYAEIELRKMKEMLSGLGFIVMLFKDLRATQMYDVIKTVTSQDMDFFLDKSDAFACVLASHGNEIQEDKPADPNIKKYHHIIYGTDEPIKTHELLDLVHERRCKKLQGKPKMFFIQACRSRFNDPNRFDTGVNVPDSTKRHVTKSGRDKNESITTDPIVTSEDTKSKGNPTLVEPPCKNKLENGSNKSDIPVPESPSNTDPFSSGDRASPQEIGDNVGNKDFISQISEERFSEPPPEDEEDLAELSHKLNSPELIPCLEVEIIHEPTKDIPEDPTKDIPENPTKDIPENPTKDFSEDPTKDIPEDPTEDIPEDPTEDIPEDPSIFQKGFKWVKKRVFKRKDRVPRNEVEAAGDSVTTVATPCHNDYLVMYSTSEGKAGFGRIKEGGWMIHVMHQKIIQHINFIGQDRRNCIDFLSFMTCVIRSIGFYYTTNTGNPNSSGFKTAPTMQHKLSKDLIFRNKYPKV